ncbi:hypothetical protein PFTANZ_01446 [Plasmodium falciparum Tanzania (2000708)]|uniref:Uncharacterized protein n=1 Tax=Plasmodium falciparum Tanzania (2000708) TaxID=1036725 RepID=A0A024WAE4_PLAFA|nr:hypothetical protein PFTANZ_01446 [Plasmodium falciparum Tanzania (2000708)]
MSHPKRCALNSIESDEKENILSIDLNNVLDTYKKTNTDTTGSDKITVLINKEKSNNKNGHSNNKDGHSNNIYNDNIHYNNEPLLKNNELKGALKIEFPFSTPINNEKKNFIYSNNIFYKYYINNYEEEQNGVHTNNNYNLHSNNTTNYAHEINPTIHHTHMNNINNNSNNISANIAKDVLRAWYNEQENQNDSADSKNSNTEYIRIQKVYETNDNDMNPFFYANKDFKNNKYNHNKIDDQCVEKYNDNKKIFVHSKFIIISFSSYLFLSK